MATIGAGLDAGSGAGVEMVEVSETILSAAALADSSELHAEISIVVNMTISTDLELVLGDQEIFIGALQLARLTYRRQ